MDLTAFNFAMLHSAAPAAIELVVPGFIVEGTVAPGFAGVFRISVHDGAGQRRLPSGGHELIVHSARARWYGVYSQRVFADAWEPMDQPNPAAYLPLRFTDLDRRPVSDRFTLLIQHGWQSTAIRRTLPRDGSDTVRLVNDLSKLKEECRQLLKALDLNSGEVESCLALVWSSL